jgi:hypothetical protein
MDQGNVARQAGNGPSIADRERFIFPVEIQRHFGNPARLRADWQRHGERDAVNASRETYPPASAEAQQRAG